MHLSARMKSLLICMCIISVSHATYLTQEAEGCAADQVAVSVVGGIGAYCVDRSPCSGTSSNLISTKCPGAGTPNVDNENPLAQGSCCTVIKQDSDIVGCVSLQFPGVNCIAPLPNEPTDEPTPVPTSDNGDDPTDEPTDEPTPVPTPDNGDNPTTEPTPVPTPDTGDNPADGATPVPTPDNGDGPTDEPVTSAPGNGDDGEQPANDGADPIGDNVNDGNVSGERGTDDDGSALSSAGIAGIVIGSVLVAAILVGLIVFKKKSSTSSPTPSYLPNTAGENVATGTAGGNGGGLTPRSNVALL